jgi:hypothetical protein
MTFFAIVAPLGCVEQLTSREALCGMLVADYHGVFSVVVVSDGALLA